MPINFYEKFLRKIIIVRLMSQFTLLGWHKYKESKHYSLLTSIVTAFVATIFLWWLPIFGPMISGYVAGRTSGSRYKGLISTAVVAGVIGLSSFIFTYVIPVPASVTAYLSSTIVFSIHSVSPYAAWFLSSLGTLFTSFTGYLAFVPPSWAILVVFGFIGGNMSELLVKDQQKSSVLSRRHPTHNELEALKPKQVDYAPIKQPHPFLGKIIRDREVEDSQEDYI